MELKDDNGGIVLDISEHGLAMQAVKRLGNDAYAQLRFQLSQSNYWIETQGRIAWISASKQTAGVEFIDLSYESLIFIKNWISSIAFPSAREENAMPDSIVPPKSALPFDEPANVTSIPEPAKSDLVVEELLQELITEDLAAMLPGNAGAASGNASREDECRTLSENISPTNGLDLTLHLQDLGPGGLLANNQLPGIDSKPRRNIGLLVGVALLLTVLIFFGYFLRNAANGQLDEKPTSSEKLAEARSNNSTSSMIAPHKPGASSAAGFIIQVAATKDEKSAILLADLLRQKGFAAYVFKPATENFYRVLAGPYGDANSAAKVEAELRKQGFEVIRKKNTLAQ
jgi:SPOR domain/PilZ domain